MDTIKHIKVSFTNCFLLECNTGYLLIDTGFPGEYKSFLKELAKMNIMISDIKYLLLTHYHDDHAGFAKELLEGSNAKLIVHKNAVSFLEKGERLEYKGKFLNLCVEFLLKTHATLSKRPQKYLPFKIKKDDYILDGDDSNLLQKIGLNGKILYTPGHSWDSISVILSDGSAIVGDAAMNFLNICRCKHRPIYAEDYNEVYKSWQKLLKEGAKVIYPSHGKPFSAEKLKLILNDRTK